MKKIYIAYLKNDDNIKLAINFIKVILNKSNSLIKIIDEINDKKIENVINKKEPVNCIFYSYFNSPENIQLLFRKFNINSFYRNIDHFIEDAYDDLKLLSTEPYDKENSDRIKDILMNDCMYFQYNEFKDVISFFVKIFFDILTLHRLFNGNKRVATMVLYKLCYNYGFFVKNSLGKDSYYYWQSNENKIIEFVEHYQSNYLNDKVQTSIEVQREIYEWLMDNLYIANNFHIEKDN